MTSLPLSLGLCIPGVRQIGASAGKDRTTPAEVNGKSRSPCCHQLSTSSPSHLKEHSAQQLLLSVSSCQGCQPLHLQWPWPAQVHRNTSYQKHPRDKKKINKFFMVYLVDHANIEFWHVEFKSKFPQVFIRIAFRSPEILWGRPKRILPRYLPFLQLQLR